MLIAESGEGKQETAASVLCPKSQLERSRASVCLGFAFTITEPEEGSARANVGVLGCPKVGVYSPLALRCPLAYGLHSIHRTSAKVL